jgi:hypothetical protein
VTKVGRSAQGNCDGITIELEGTAIGTGRGARGIRGKGTANHLAGISMLIVEEGGNSIYDHWRRNNCGKFLPNRSVHLIMY